MGEKVGNSPEFEITLIGEALMPQVNATTAKAPYGFWQLRLPVTIITCNWLSIIKNNCDFLVTHLSKGELLVIYM